MMYNGEEIIHTTASANLSFATGWLILSIVLGSVLTFTFFTAISTSFYCCQKPIKKDDKDSQNLVDQGNPVRKLFFPNVPTTVYPTTQSILQQEDNEVIDSLTPAYRELPSTHFSYISSFNGSITMDPTSSFGNQQNTLYPNSTKSSILPHTSSDELRTHSITTGLAPEQLNQEQDRKRSGFSSKINDIDDSNILIHTTTPPNGPTTLQAPSSSLHHPTNDSSLSIHINNAPADPQMCMTSATSGIITEEDLTIHAGNENLGHNLELVTNRPASNDQRLSGSAMNDVQLNKPSTDNQRLCTKVTENTPISTDQKTSHTEYTADDSSRGASCFGGLELSPKTRAFSPDYYALTFRREGSALSDISCCSNRGASAFATDGQRGKPIIVSPDCVTEMRGASAFDKTSEFQTARVDTTQPAEKTRNLQTESLNFSKEPSTSYNAAESEVISKRSPSDCTLIQAPERKSFHENILFEQEKRKTPDTRGRSQTIAKSFHSKMLIPRNVDGEGEEKGISKKKNEPDIITSSSDSTVATETRSNSPFAQSLSKVRKLPNGYKASDLNSELNSSERMPNKRSITPTNNHSITSNLHRPRTYEKSKTRQKCSSDYLAPIKILQNVSTNSSDPIKEGKCSLLKLNSSCQSLRGASQLGCLGDEVDGVCSDSDACWDSVSLSFAYESASDEDITSYFAFKEN